MAKGDVIARIVRSDGAEMTFGDQESNWRILKNGLDGWANLNYTVTNSEIPSYDGSIITSKRVSSQDRSIKAVLENAAVNADERAKVISFFSPKYSYEAHLTYMGRTRWCKGEQIGFKCSEFNIYEPAEFTWTILCANPYLQSEENFGKDIAEAEPRLGFPFMSFYPVEKGSAEGCNVGFVASKRIFEPNVIVGNYGDVPSGMRFVIMATREVTNPIIRIDDKQVKAIVKMVAGDVLDIDLTHKPPQVHFNGKNGMNLIDRKSNILDLTLLPGDTTIIYDADAGEQYMSVTVYYNEQFLGI